jgi:hypothetical protein
MIMAAWLMRCLSQGHHTPSLAGEDGKHTSEDLISAGPCLLRREGGQQYGRERKGVYFVAFLG